MLCDGVPSDKGQLPATAATWDVCSPLNVPVPWQAGSEWFHPIHLYLLTLSYFFPPADSVQVRCSRACRPLSESVEGLRGKRKAKDRLLGVWTPNLKGYQSTGMVPFSFESTHRCFPKRPAWYQPPTGDFRNLIPTPTALDCPTSALDAPQVVEAWRKLQVIAQQTFGVIILYSSSPSDLGTVRARADKGR